MAKRKPGARSPKRTRRKSVRAAPTVPVTLIVRRIVAIDWFRRFTRHRCLCFTMQHQQQTQWCWSATATSVAHYYNGASTWTQCSLVNAELGRTDCCTAPSSANCNQPWTLNTVLTRVGHLASFTGGSTSFADVRNEIDNGRPLGVRIGWRAAAGTSTCLAATLGVGYSVCRASRLRTRGTGPPCGTMRVPDRLSGYRIVDAFV